MEIKDIIRIQDEFDKTHASRKPWNNKIDENNLDVLEYLLICLIGEVGEAANLTKKIVRGDFSYKKEKAKIEEEVIDIFIYLIKICNQMDIDVEKKYLRKIEKNKKRFIKYKSKRMD